VHGCWIKDAPHGRCQKGCCCSLLLSRFWGGLCPWLCMGQQQEVSCGGFRAGHGCHISPQAVQHRRGAGLAMQEPQTVTLRARRGRGGDRTGATAACLPQGLGGQLPRVAQRGQPVQRGHVHARARRRPPVPAAAEPLRYGDGSVRAAPRGARSAAPAVAAHADTRGGRACTRSETPVGHLECVRARQPTRCACSQCCALFATHTGEYNLRT